MGSSVIRPIRPIRPKMRIAEELRLGLTRAEDGLGGSGAEARRCGDPKPETRNPKPEGNPRAEIRNPKAPRATSVGNFCVDPKNGISNHEHPKLPRLLPRPFRRGEGRGEGLLGVVYPAILAVNLMPPLPFILPPFLYCAQWVRPKRVRASLPRLLQLLRTFAPSLFTIIFPVVSPRCCIHYRSRSEAAMPSQIILVMKTDLFHLTSSA